MKEWSPTIISELAAVTTANTQQANINNRKAFHLPSKNATCPQRKQETTLKLTFPLCPMTSSFPALRIVEKPKFLREFCFEQNLIYDF